MEGLDILLHAAWFRCWKPHDDLEEVLAVCFGLRDDERSEAFQVSPDAIFSSTVKPQRAATPVTK